MTFQHLNDQELIASTRRALQASRDAEVEVLRHFREIEERKLWWEEGSLYQFLAKTFHLTSDQVYPRLQAMRVMCVVPEVEEKLEKGELSVTNVLKAHQAFRAEEKNREISLEEKREVLFTLENASTKEAEKALAQKYPESWRAPEKVKPMGKNLNLMQFYADDEMVREIEELKAKYSHQMPEGKMEDLLRILIALAKREPKPRQSKPVQTRSRYVPAAVKREKEKTRHEGCQHINSQTGEGCGSTHFLQLDHIQEFSRGGATTSENLQWLCGAHNRFRFETRCDESKSPAKKAEAC